MQNLRSFFAAVARARQPKSDASSGRAWTSGALVALMLGLTAPTWAQAPAAETPPAETSAITAAATPAPYPNLISSLIDAGYTEKRALAEQILASGDAGAERVLRALLNDHLYSRDSDHKVYIAEEVEAGLKLTDAVTLADAGTEAADGFSKIGTNNALRKFLRGALAQFQLAAAKPATRLAAVKELARDLDDGVIELLRQQREGEKDASVRAAIDAVLALADLDNTDAEIRLAAVDALANSLDNDVYNKLKALSEVSADGTAAEPDPRVRAAAAVAVHHIEFSRSIYGGIETLFFGLSLGSVLVLAAIGLAITFGVMGVINMAHGELMMLGAYTAYVMQQLLPGQVTLSILLSIPAAFLVAGAVGIAIERGVVRFLYGRPLETLLATFGLSLILQQLVRSVFSPLNRSVATPPFMSGTLVINDALSITYNRLYIVLFTVLVFIALQLVLKRTSLGLKVRAVSQNRAMARAMGIRSEWIDAATFGLGSGVAGVAGVALSQLTNVGPNLGQAYIIDSFMVVVFGGVGNLWGTMIGGMTLGVVGKLLEPAAGAVMAKILVLVFIILFIQRRKQGLFPQKGRAAEGH